MIQSLIKLIHREDSFKMLLKYKFENIRNKFIKVTDMTQMQK
jgi:hypothetical protein